MKYLVIFSIIFFSCNTEKAALRKYAKLKAMHPTLFKTDSVRVIDTITVELRDTIIREGEERIVQVPLRDTIIESDILRLEFYFDQLNRLMLNAKAKSDTIYIDRVIQVPYDKIVACPERVEKSNKWVLWIIPSIIIASLLLSIIVAFVQEKIFKK